MLEKQFDDLGTLKNGSPAMQSATTVITEAHRDNIDNNNNNSYAELATWVTVIDELISSQNQLLDSLNTYCGLLLKENLSLKFKNLLSSIKNIQCAHKETDRIWDLGSENDTVNVCKAGSSTVSVGNKDRLMCPSSRSGLGSSHRFRDGRLWVLRS